MPPKKGFNIFRKKTNTLPDSIGVYAQGKMDKDDADTFDMNWEYLNKSSIVE